MTTKHWTAKWPYIVNAVSPVVQNHGENFTFVGFTGAIALVVGYSTLLMRSLVRVLAMSAVFCSGLLTWSADIYVHYSDTVLQAIRVRVE